MGQSNFENLLAAMTEAIMEDGQDLDHIVRRYAVQRQEVEGFIHIIRRLHVALVGVRPSRRFAYRLRQELLGQPEWNVINRVRFLPARVQIAAGVALLAGFMLLSRRRLIAELTDSPAPDEAPATS